MYEHPASRPLLRRPERPVVTKFFPLPEGRPRPFTGVYRAIDEARASIEAAGGVIDDETGEVTFTAYVENAPLLVARLAVALGNKAQLEDALGRLH